jgi:hypothetical protein
MRGLEATAWTADDSPANGLDDAIAGTRRPAQASAWVALAAVIVALLTASSGVPVLGAGEFGRVAAGLVQAERGGDWVTVPVGETVADGTTVRTQDEYAELEIRDGRLSLARSTRATVDGEEVALDRGGVLFEADRTYHVEAGANAARGRGTWRVDASGLVRFAAYEGGAAVTDPTGREVAVPRLRELPVIAAGSDADAVVPLRYLPNDAWDQRLMAEAIRIDAVLANTSTTLARRYGTALQPAAFYDDFARFADLTDHLARLAPRSGPAGFGPPAETLVAMIVGDPLVARARLTPAEAARRIDHLRTEGATWGLIAVEHDLTAADLDRSVDTAARERGERVEEGTAVPPRVDVAPEPPEPSGPAEDGDDDDDGGTDPPDDGDGDDPPDPPTDPDPPDDDPGTLDPVEEQVDDLGSLLDEVVPGASEVTDEVSDTVDTVDDLLPDVGKLTDDAVATLTGWDAPAS